MSEPRRWPGVVGWLLVVLLAAAWSAVAWLGLGLSVMARVAAASMTTLIVLLQVLLSRWRMGGMARAVAALAVSGLAIFAAVRWIAAEQLMAHASPAGSASRDGSPGFSFRLPLGPGAGSGAWRGVPSAVPPAGAGSGAAEGAEPPATGDRAVGDRAVGDRAAGDRYAKLPHAKRYDCGAQVKPSADIAALKSGYGASNWRARMIALLEARFPDGAAVVGRLQSPALFDVWFAGGKGDWSRAMTELSVGVHESSHLVDLATRRGNQHALVVSEERTLRFAIPKTYHRSELRAQLPAPIAKLSYTGTYLAGSSGAQGFEMVLEELNAYIFSVLTAVAVADQLPAGMSTSARDGLMTFIYYTEGYLRLARTKKSATYSAITNNRALRDAVIELNDRAECALSLTAGRDNLGISDHAIWPYVFGPQALGEIDRLRSVN